MAASSKLAVLIAVLALATPLASGATAQTTPPPRPEILSTLVACRGISEAGARLACYDAAAGALDTAERRGDVVVVDRAQVTAARRQLFGFSLPSITLFDAGEQAAPIDSIETTLTRATLVGEGRWVFTLADGSVWRQIDSERVSFRNQSGEPVRVRKASLGSFFLTVGGSRAVRARRQ